MNELLVRGPSDVVNETQCGRMEIRLSLVKEQTRSCACRVWVIYLRKWYDGCARLLYVVHNTGLCVVTIAKHPV